MVFMLMLMLQSGDRGAAGQSHKVHTVAKMREKGTFHSPFHSARVEKTPYRYPPLPAVTLTAALAA